MILIGGFPIHPDRVPQIRSPVLHPPKKPVVKQLRLIDFGEALFEFSGFVPERQIPPNAQKERTKHLPVNFALSLILLVLGFLPALCSGRSTTLFGEPTGSHARVVSIGKL